MVNVSATATPRSYIAHVCLSNINTEIYWYLSTIIGDSGKLWQVRVCVCVCAKDSNGKIGTAVATVNIPPYLGEQNLSLL